MTNERVSIPLALFLLLTVGVLAFFIYYGQWFPPTIAVHFNGAGVADGFMDRVKFIVVGTTTSFILPPFVVALIGVLPRVVPTANLNVPDKEYWTATPERREAFFSRLLVIGLWFGCLLQIILFAVWVMIARSNPAGLPPHLAPGHGVVIGLVPVMVVGFMVFLFSALQRPR